MESPAHWTPQEEAWIALSDLFVDNEPDYRYMFRCLKHYSLPQLQEMLFNDVAPVCACNFMVIIPPVWTGFSEQELIRDITQQKQKLESASWLRRATHNAFVFFLRWRFNNIWREFAHQMQRRWKRGPLSPRHLGLMARKALMLEATASPKPGLVCPDHNGAHNDMDYAHFVASANALLPYFENCAQLGALHHRVPALEMLPLLRQAGIEGEKAMFAVTGGINTHKGVVFSLGLLCAAYARLQVTADPVHIFNCCAEAAAFVQGIVERELAPLTQNPPNRKLTAGERFYLEQGITGARGEAEAGFPSLTSAYADTYFENPLSLNKGLPNILLRLMAKTTDTNILSRGGPQALEYVKAQAAAALDAGGMNTEEGTQMVFAMRDAFTERRLSPGGSADLLGLIIFFHLLEMAERYLILPDENGTEPPEYPPTPG